MDKGFFATDFSFYGSGEYVKIDFFEMEPETAEDGKVVVSRGISQRITIPRKTAEALLTTLEKMTKKD